jgi:hypothetical protein
VLVSGARQTAGYLLPTVRSGGSPYALAGAPIADYAPGAGG